jgi:hypothetical protein
MSQPPMTPGYQPQQPQPGSGLGTAAFVLGIVAICATVVLFCFPFIGGLLGVVAIILGGIAMSQAAQNPKAASKGKTGLILGIASIVLAGGITIAAVMIGHAAKTGGNYFQQKAADMEKETGEAQKKAMEQAVQQGRDSSSTSSDSELTMAKYMRIQNGMSYNEVCQILGQQGEEVSRNHIDGAPGVIPSVDTVMYTWKGTWPANMNATFQNDKLMSKAQLGLK